ncbi:hypothetical protein [Streptomyces jumonjinensis]|nr:hypothetical protein [Streptomyces jumonjinensis]
MRTITPRVLGIAEVPYLAELRGVDTPGDGLDLRAVQRAARALRRSLGLAE